MLTFLIKFQDKIQVLYRRSYTIKFMLKLDKKEPFDFTVPPLSGLWCADDITAFAEGREHEWKWALMILMPDRVTREVFEEGKRKLKEKKNPKYRYYRSSAVEKALSIKRLKDMGFSLHEIKEIVQECSDDIQ